MKKVLLGLAALSISGCTLINSHVDAELNVRCIPSVESAKTKITAGRFTALEQEHTFLLPRGESILVTCMADGHRNEKIMVKKELSSLTFLDAIATPFLLIPAFGFFTDGIYDLETNDITLYLEPVK